MLESFRLAWAERRNRLIASPALRRLANRFPPARLPARRYARRLFDLSAGFVYSQTVQALVESGLLERASRGAVTVVEAAAVADLSPRQATTLLKAAASLDLMEEHGGRWLLAPLGAALAASPGLPEMIRHHRLFYADLADPLAMLRARRPGALAKLWHYGADANPDDVATYSALMAAMQPMVAEQALTAYDFGRHRALLDVGGGTGGFLAQVRQAVPQLSLSLFDRPAVIESAGERDTAGVTLHAGDFLVDPLPTNHDLISLVRVLHDHDDGPALRLMTNARAALDSGGTLLIVEPLAETAGAEPIGHAYFGLYLAAMQSGRPRSFTEYKVMLRQAGFRRVRAMTTPLPLIASVIAAQL